MKLIKNFKTNSKIKTIDFIELINNKNSKQLLGETWEIFKISKESVKRKRGLHISGNHSSCQLAHTPRV
jgi:hypothetical protein